jgi:hypothetical protein
VRLPNERREVAVRPALTAGQQLASQGVHLPGGGLGSALRRPQLANEGVQLVIAGLELNGGLVEVDQGADLDEQAVQPPSPQRPAQRRNLGPPTVAGPPDSDR